MPSSCPVCGAAWSTVEGASACPLAADWADEERMEFLTSHVAPGDDNARDQMLAFWSTAVAHVFEEAPALSLNLDVLARSSLSWDGLTAPGAELAVEHMVSSGKLVQRGAIEEEGSGIARRLVVAPLMYLAGVMGAGTLRGKGESEYVHSDVLEAAAEAVVSYCRRLPSDERTVYLIATGHSNPAAGRPAGGEGKEASPWCFEQLCREAAAVSRGSRKRLSGSPAAEGAPPAATRAPGDRDRASTSPPDQGGTSHILSRIGAEDIALLVKYLVRTKRAVEEGSLLKVFTGGGGAGGTGRPVPAGEVAISETEKDLLRLRCTVASLEASALDLGQRIQRLKLDALRENRQGQKRAALVHMKRMKQLQSAREKRLSSLFTLETALDQVKQLRMDKQVLEAHEAATSALKACREAQGLTVERVEDTLDALAEEMAEQQAIAAALAQQGALLSDDEGERADLEAELDALLQGEGTTNTPNEGVATAAKVPPTAPFAAAAAAAAAAGSTTPAAGAAASATTGATARPADAAGGSAATAAGGFAGRRPIAVTPWTGASGNKGAPARTKSADRKPAPRPPPPISS
ncbi:unnamed protein product [Scytosiphon promiscuus]